MLTHEELIKLRKLAEKAAPGPYVAHDDRGWATPCIGRITSDGGYTLMHGLCCTIGKWEREMEQAEYWAFIYPERVIAMIDEIERLRAANARLAEGA